MVALKVRQKPLHRTRIDDSSRHIHYHIFGVRKNESLFVLIVIVIVNPRFLERPQKRSRGNQLIHKRLSKKIDRQRVISRESGRLKRDPTISGEKTKDRSITCTAL